MKTLQILAIVILIVSTSCTTPEPTVAPSPEPDRAADETAIRGIVTRAQQAINSRDFAAYSELFDADSDFIALDWPKSRGPAAIQQAMEEAWAEAPPERRISLVIDEIRFLDRDVAVADITASFSAGEPAVNRATSVYVRSGDGWTTAVGRVYSALAE